MFELNEKFILDESKARFVLLEADSDTANKPLSWASTKSILDKLYKAIDDYIAKITERNNQINDFAKKFANIKKRYDSESHTQRANTTRDIAGGIINNASGLLKDFADTIIGVTAFKRVAPGVYEKLEQGITPVGIENFWGILEGDKLKSLLITEATKNNILKAKDAVVSAASKVDILAKDNPHNIESKTIQDANNKINELLSSINDILNKSGVDLLREGAKKLITGLNDFARQLTNILGDADNAQKATAAKSRFKVDWHKLMEAAAKENSIILGKVATSEEIRQLTAFGYYANSSLTLKDVINLYFKVEWAKQEQYIEAIKPIIIEQCNKYGYSAATNPFITFLRNYIGKLQISYGGYRAISEHVGSLVKVNTLKVAPDELEADNAPDGTGTKNNIIFSNVFYSFSSSECTRYLELQASAAKCWNSRDTQRFGEQRWSSFIIELFTGSDVTNTQATAWGDTMNSPTLIEQTLANEFGAEAFEKAKKATSAESINKNKKSSFTDQDINDLNLKTPSEAMLAITTAIMKVLDNDISFNPDEIFDKLKADKTSIPADAKSSINMSKKLAKFTFNSSNIKQFCDKVAKLFENDLVRVEAQQTSTEPNQATAANATA